MPPFLLRYSEQSGRGEMLPCPFLRPYESQRSIVHNYQKHLTKKNVVCYSTQCLIFKGK